MEHYKVYPIGQIKIGEGSTSIKLAEKYFSALKGLEGFSHINVLCWFDGSDTDEARNILEVPAPYKKAPDIMGIFATRSPVRPNPIALSAVQILDIDQEKGIIHIAYIDAEDGTPVLDLKPYTPSLDRVEKPAVPQWCSHWPKSCEDSGNFNWANEFNF